MKQLEKHNATVRRSKNKRKGATPLTGSPPVANIKPRSNGSHSNKKQKTDSRRITRTEILEAMRELDGMQEEGTKEDVSKLAPLREIFTFHMGSNRG